MNKKIVVQVCYCTDCNRFEGIYLIDDTYDIWDLINDYGTCHYYLVYDYYTLRFIEKIDGYDL